MEQRPAVSEACRKLYEVREKRTHPGCDGKLLSSWNGQIVAAFTESARALDRDDYCEVAQRNADFLLRGLRQENGRLRRLAKDGKSKLSGCPQDCACVPEDVVKPN